jgi:hypothetical protein
MGSASRLLQVTDISHNPALSCTPPAPNPHFSQLFSVFSRRKILCASGSNHRYLLLVLEAINNIIQYQ